MRTKRNEITLQNTRNGITCTFDGPHSREIFELFGTNVLPYGGATNVEASEIVREVSKLNPGCLVSFV